MSRTQVSHPVPGEPELTPYTALAPEAFRPMLILAPHPDDEVLGCGGLIASARKHDVSVDVTVVSSGEMGGDPLVRTVESRQSARVLGYARELESPSFWGLPDRSVTADTALVQRIRIAARELRVMWLLAPSPFEVHPDHRAVCVAATEAARELDVDLVYYEVGQPMVVNALVDITDVMETKHRALQQFASQLAQQDYSAQILGLNRYRAYTLGAACTHAEGYHFVPRHVAERGMDGALAHILGEIQRRTSWPSVPGWIQE